MYCRGHLDPRDRRGLASKRTNLRVWTRATGSCNYHLSTWRSNCTGGDVDISHCSALGSFTACGYSCGDLSVDTGYRSRDSAFQRRVDGFTACSSKNGLKLVSIMIVLVLYIWASFSCLHVCETFCACQYDKPGLFGAAFSCHRKWIWNCETFTARAALGTRMVRRWY